MELFKKVYLFLLIIPVFLSICIVKNAEAAVPSWPPTSLIATSISQSEIDISWIGIDASGQGVTGYRIERESPVGGGFAIVVANTGTTATTYASINLAPGATYNYRVSAVNNDGASLPSQPSYATTQNAPNISISAAPTNLLATPVSGTEINLSWTAPQNAATFTGYRIERENGIGNGFYTIVYNTSTTATNYADTNLAPGAIYNYHVAAMYGYGAGVFSASASTSTLTQPGAPRNVKAVSGNNQATISWLPPSYGGTVSNYVIFNGLNSSTTATANATSAIITGLTNGSYYSFSVAASNAAGTGMSISAGMVMPQAQASSSLITFSQVTSTAIATPQTPSSSQTIVNPSLTQITSSSNYVFTAPLMKGARGKAVTELQKRLVALEYLKVEPTGYFGILTEAAVKAYQIARNIEALGGVGPLTRAVLNSGK